MSADFVTVSSSGPIATVSLSRGKVNALNLAVVEQLQRAFEALERDDSARAIVLTGRGAFFSFGFDIPEFMPASREGFTEYLVRFTDFYRYLFTYPKPVVAALNGHAIAGGCMVALACDHRLMVTGKARISLNEVTFGSSVFAGATEMLRFAAGSQNAATVLYSGALFTSGEAERLGLVEEIPPERFDDRVREVASDFAAKDGVAFASIKRLLRQTIAQEFAAREMASIREFVDVWYSPATREQLAKITIRG